MNVPDDKERLREILERDEYTAYHASSGESLLDLIRRWLGKLFDFWPDLHVSDGAGSAVAYGLAAVVFGLLVWAIYWFSKQIVHNGRFRPGKPLLSDEELTWSQREYMRRAEELKAEGAWRESLRYLFLALLFHMQEMSWVSVEKWKTNWEYGEELQRSREGLVPFFRSSARLFDRVWYGKEPIDEAGLTAFYEQVRSTVRETEASRDAQTN